MERFGRIRYSRSGAEAIADIHKRFLQELRAFPSTITIPYSYTWNPHEERSCCFGEVGEIEAVARRNIWNQTLARILISCSTTRAISPHSVSFPCVCIAVVPPYKYIQPDRTGGSGVGDILSSFVLRDKMQEQRLCS